MRGFTSQTHTKLLTTNWIIRNTEGKSSKDAGKVKGRWEERRDTHSETWRWEKPPLAEGRGRQFAFDMGLI